MPPVNPDLVSGIIGAESSGDPNAQNTQSSAGGLGQFINSTWLDMLRKYKPDLAALPQGQQLQLKFDPELSREMTGRYAQENSDILSAKGLPVTPGALYLAHFAGPQGAIKALSVDPATPIDQVMTPAALRANPFLATQGITTAGDLIDWAGRRVGKGGSATAQAQATPTAPAGTPGPATAGLMPQLGGAAAMAGRGLGALGNLAGGAGQMAQPSAPSFLALGALPQMPQPYFAPRIQPFQPRQLAQLPQRGRVG
jgi:hypothetical protein